MEDDNSFHQIRVIEIVDIEFDIEDPPAENVARILLRSRRDDALAVEFPLSMLPEIVEAFSDAIKKWPQGQRTQ